MGIIAQIFGKSDKKAEALHSADAVREAIARLERTRAEARKTIDDALTKRSEMLLVDGSDRDIEKFNAAADAAHLTLERLDAVEPQLHARLRELQTESRRSRLGEIELEYADTVTVLDGAMSVAIGAFQDYLEIVKKIDAEGFAVEGRSFTVAPPMLAGGVICSAVTLENWRAERDRNTAMRAGRRTSPHNQVTVEQAAANIAARKAPERAQLQDPEYRRPHSREPRKIDETPAFGFCKAVVLRHGLEIGGEARVIGDELIVSSAEAERLARNGAVDVVAHGEIGKAAE